MFIYNFLILVYGLVIRTASIRKEKARNWVRGRKNWKTNLANKINALNSEEKVWVHCASYGEFEQGRPLIEEIKKRHPGKKIILTFFSPSGFEAFKNWHGADVIAYLPLDTPSNAENFITIVKPELAIFIKYEFWVNFLSALKAHRIPTYLVSATFKEHQPFFKSYGGIFRRSLLTFNKLFIQDKESAVMLEKIGIKNIIVSGDTRFDRVLQVKNGFKEIPEIRDFKGGKKLIIAGSTWPKDEELVLNAFEKLNDTTTKLILVPHDIEDKLIKETIRKISEKGLTYSLFTEGINNDSQVLILNTMGLLSRIYYYADCAYIGGGFAGGLHNTLEAAVYKIPVTFYGKDYVNYNEAVQLLKLEAATCIANEEELAAAFRNYLNNIEGQKVIANKLEIYFRENEKVSEKILKEMCL